MPPMKHDGSSAPSPTVERHPLPVLGDPRDSQAAHDHDHDHDHEHDHDHGDLFAAAQAVTPAPGEHGFGPTYWRSIEEKLGAPEVQEALDREFPVGATEPPQGFARREFLGLVGASLALAGLDACTKTPDEKILPYTRNPVNVHPGTPLHYATSTALDGYATGLLVTSWEGRPTKVEGNPDHPATGGGATSAFEQASVLQLYDPQRASVLAHQGKPLAWRTFIAQMAQHAKAMEADGGARVRFLMEPSASPLLGDLRARLAKRFPKARFHSYAANTRQSVHDGAKLAFGEALEPNYDFAKTDVVLSLDSDFLQPTPENLRYSRPFADRRDPSRGAPNRLYVVESMFTLTGGMADNRLRLRSSDVHGFALALMDELAGRGGNARPRTQKFASGELRKWIQVVAADLRRAGNRALVVAGHRQPAAVHAIAHALNETLGAAGNTVTYTRPVLHDTATGPASLKALADDIKAGSVDTLVITAWNPAYAAPGDLDLVGLLPKVPNAIYRGLHVDETARVCSWFIPAAHPLESWGDTRSADGTVSIIQPLIAPLFNGFTEADVLAALLDQGAEGTYALLREFWGRQTKAAATFESDWESWLAKGVVPGPAAEQVPARLAANAAAAIDAASNAPVPEGMELSFVADYKVHDGRFANVSWLQELPHPITKMVWDNAALVSPTTGAKLDLASGDKVKLEYRGRSLELPVWILPGHADDSVTVALGYGRTGAEEVAAGAGYDVNPLRSSEAPWFDGGLTVTKARGQHEFAITQGHWSMKSTPHSEPRPLALEQPYDEFMEEPEKLTEELKKPLPTFQEPVKYEGLRWAMAVDLTRCTGCSACVVACQSENNIPVVGKEQVKRGREMQWLRIDRYFKGPLDNPTAITQPVACVHCEAAPCEYVCPVNATVHSDEGLNEMVYNRCVGTRYCSNNCPYKVRRFNYLHYTANRTAVEQMAQNPDVTVRARGVMEKCTYCVQRIERTRIAKRVAGQEFGLEGDVITACQQACPTGAISFGTLSDPNSMVSKLHREQRRYNLLHDLNTRPRTAYLMRIKNPNPELVNSHE